MKQLYIGKVHLEDESGLFDMQCFTQQMCSMNGYQLSNSWSMEFYINLIPEAQPIYHALRYLPAPKQAFLDEKLVKLLKLRVIQLCFSE